MRSLKKLSKLKMRRKILKRNNKSRSSIFVLKCKKLQIMLESKNKRRTEQSKKRPRLPQKNDKYSN